MFSRFTPRRDVVLGAGDARGPGAVDDHPDLTDVLADDSRAFSNAAPEMMAVPCWSSWNTGIFMVFFSSSSIWKHSGALMSSRLMPPKVGSRSRQTLITSSGSSRVDLDVEHIDIGKALEEDPLAFHDRLPWANLARTTRPQPPTARLSATAGPGTCSTWARPTPPRPRPGARLPVPDHEGQEHVARRAVGEAEGSHPLPGQAGHLLLGHRQPGPDRQAGRRLPHVLQRRDRPSHPANPRHRPHEESRRSLDP